MQTFTSIEAIHQVIKTVQKTMASPPEVQYRGTIKLHGTNAGVACSSEGLVPQSRSREITVKDDNMGFALFVSGESQTKAIREIEATIRARHNLAPNETLYLYGEWCGPGIMKGTALNQLPTRQWVLFQARVVSGARDEYLDALFPFEDKHAEAQIYSIQDVLTWTLTIHFGDRSSQQAALDQATALTETVETQCPWGTKFGAEGIGEGIVWTPLHEHWGLTDLFFKTKGEKHKKVKSSRERPSIDPEVLQSITEFVEFAVTEGRLEQGLDVLKEQGHGIEMRSMGHFLKWVAADVSRECAAELEASTLQWTQVQGAVQVKAREFFKGACQTL